MQPRIPRHRHVDPLDHVWLALAARLGLRVERTREANATTDGRGLLLLGAPDTLDPDDNLAQMVLHETCHWLVQGEGASGQPDWGLDNQSARDDWREEATLRVQAVLLGRHGLRRALAPTTDWRAFYDALPANPLEPRSDPAASLALEALARADRPPFSPHLDAALAATAVIGRAARDAGAGDGGLPVLWSLVEDPPPAHPSGLPGRVAGAICGTCAWRHVARGVSRCRQAGDAKVPPLAPACERHEASLACGDCGACCRGAYDTVLVGARDPVRRAQPGMVRRNGHLLELVRQGDRCAALEGGLVAAEGGGRPEFRPHACAIYADRPRTCRDFEVGGAHCLTARRRVSLSAGA